MTSRLPLGTVFGQGGVRMRRDLVAECGFLIWGNAWRTP